MTDNEHVSELEVLRQISLSMTASLDLSQVLDRIVEGVFKLLKDVSDTQIYLFENDRLVFRTALRADGSKEQNYADPREDGLTYAVARTGEVIMISNMREHPMYMNAPHDWDGAIIGQPLMVKGRVLGVMNVAYYQPHDFSEMDIHMLRLLGDQAAIAIENARLFAQTRQRVAEQTLLRQISLSMTSSLNLRIVLDLIADGVFTMMDDVANTHIYLYEEDRLTFQTAMYASGLSSEPYAELREDGLTYAVARGAAPIIVPDMRKHVLYQDVPSEWNQGAIIGQPLLINDRVVGVMNVSYHQPRTFTDSEIRVINLLADQAALAIQNARLYELGQRHAEELEDRVAERTAELKAYNHLIAHDLKAPLHLVSNYAELLTEYPEPLPDAARKYARQISDWGTRMSDMIEQLLKLAELRDATATAVPVVVRDAVDLAVARFHKPLTDAGIDLHLEDPLPDAIAHAPWIEEVFANLVGNAIKYMGKDTVDRQIWIRGTQEGTMNRYEVQDTGLGILPDEQERIFEMFTRAHKAEAAGSGLGLAIVSQIVSRLGGTLGVESVYGEGSTFWFTLPAVPSEGQT